MKAIFMLMVVALASPAFGQTTPPYDVTTAAGYPLCIRFMHTLG